MKQSSQDSLKNTACAAAYRFLEAQGASTRLIQHAQLVSEAAERLLQEVASAGISLNVEVVRLGAILHDVGKVLHPEELTRPGHVHESAGRELLLKVGYRDEVARVCESHARWDRMECSLEELIVALADKLWKGKREDVLERQVLERISTLKKTEMWETLRDLDPLFEEIATSGHERLMRTAC